MPIYISARFEKKSLPVSDLTRVVVRNLDQGSVPPTPDANYFPTSPDAYREFIVAQWSGDFVGGESFVRVADQSLDDFNLIPYRPMNKFSDAFANFTIVASPLPVQVNDILEIYPVDTTLWGDSQEYPGSSFRFTVTAVGGLLGSTNILVTPEIPSFLTGLSWTIKRVTPPSVIEVSITSGSAGIPRRDGLVAPGFFREKRFNSYFTTAIAASNFVSATKIAMQILTDALLALEISTEDYTAGP